LADLKTKENKMSRSIKYFFLLTLVITLLMVLGCAGPGTVSVGVGVGVAGPWVGPPGPYAPGGTVWIGRPITPIYYHYDPLNNHGKEWVNSDKVETPSIQAD
jgi:hypothetical protein